MAFKKKAVPAFSAESSETVNVEGKQFKVKRAITLPVWKWSDDETKFFTILDKIHESQRLSADEETLKSTRKGERELPPAKIAHVRDLLTSTMYTMIFGAGLHRDLTDNYPDDSYVGKSFKVTRLKQRKTKRGYNFNPYSVAEIETPDEEA